MMLTGFTTKSYSGDEDYGTRNKWFIGNDFRC